MKRLMRFPRIRQHDQSDCGAACLAAVAEFYGLRLPLARIRQSAGTEARGTSVHGLIRAAEALGFSARGVRAPLESLDRVPLPCIAQVVIDGVLSHFVVIRRVSQRGVTLMDPRDGRLQKVPVDRFQGSWTGILLLLVPSERFQPGESTITAGRRLLGLVKPHRLVMLQALAGAAAYTLLGLSTAVFVQKVVDHVLPDGNRNLLNLMGAGMIVLVLLQAMIGGSKDVLTLRTGQRIDAALIVGYYRHVLSLPMRFFDSMRVGEVISRVNDAVKIRAFINDTALGLAVSALVVSFSVALMFAYSWKLALLVSASLPLYGLTYWLTNRLNRTTQRRLMERAADLESQLVESVTAASTIKRFGLEPHTADRMERRFVRVLREVYAAGRTGIGANTTADLIGRLATVLMLWLGGILVLEQMISAGELMSFYALSAYLSGPVVTLIGANRSLQDAVIAADRLFEIFDLEGDPAGEETRSYAPALLGDISLDRVTFGYGTRVEVFSGMDLTIRAGSITAIVGESGSGKSTIAALLQGLYEPAQGSVRIGGVALQHLSKRALLRQIVSVPQEVHLFSGSIIQNIALGEAEPDMLRILEICAELGITDFVEKLPHGFRTDIGENGRTLSGGQRQRIAIARALYRNPQVLILDEATSALDSISESHVQGVLQRLQRDGKTVVLIAHRLSTARAADTICVLAKGRVSEEGSHEELLRTRGVYHRLWVEQFQGGACPS